MLDKILLMYDDNKISSNTYKDNREIPSKSLNHLELETIKP